LNSLSGILVAALQKQISTAAGIFGRITAAVVLQFSKLMLLCAENSLKLRLQA